MIQEQNKPEQYMQEQTHCKPGRIFVFIGGMVSGIVLAGIGMWLVMPGMMLVTHQSRFDTVEETCRQLKLSIETNRWRCSGIRDINTMLTKQGQALERQVRIVELCKAEYATEILENNPEVSTLMPCAWGVYAGNDGTVYITGMNMGLMGKMFGGTIARIMGGTVAMEERKMLRNVIRD